MNALLIVLVIILFVSGVILLGSSFYWFEEKTNRGGYILLSIGLLCLITVIFLTPIAERRWGAEKNILKQNLRNGEVSVIFWAPENLKCIKRKIQIRDGCDLTYWEVVK